MAGHHVQSALVTGALGARVVVRCVVSGEPAVEFRTGNRALPLVELFDILCIDSEFDAEPIGIDHICRHAVAMIDSAMGNTSRIKVLANHLLALGVSRQRDMVQRGAGIQRQLILILGIDELEESKGRTVVEPEERVAVSAFTSADILDLAPCRNERETKNVLIELSRDTLVCDDMGMVVQALS
jgi:hypothetical protein